MIKMQEGTLAFGDILSLFSKILVRNGLLKEYINPISWGNSVNLGHFTENRKKGDPSPNRIVL
jgi:hypothetical protein